MAFVYNIKDNMTSRGLSATQALQEAFNQSLLTSNLSNSPTIVFDSGTYDIGAVELGYKASVTKVVIRGGNGTLSGAEAVKLNMNKTMKLGHPTEWSGVAFLNRNTSSSILCRRNPTGSSKQKEDDMDTTFQNCVFSGGGGDNNIDINYRGRNLVVRGCKFRTGNKGVGIRLSYFNNTSEAAVQGVDGWKAITIDNNRVHNYPSGFIQIDKSVNGNCTLKQLIIYNNYGEYNTKLVTYRFSKTVVTPTISLNNIIFNTKGGTCVDLPKGKAVQIFNNTFQGVSSTRRINGIKAIEASGNITYNNFVYNMNSAPGSITVQGGKTPTEAGNKFINCKKRVYLP